MKTKNVILMFFLMFFIWLALNASFDIQIVSVGAFVSFLVAIFFASKSDFLSSFNLTPKAIIYSIIYIFVFLKEMIKANIDVAFRVISPSLPINPGVVKVKTKLKSKIGRLALANSITLTPGTLSVDIKDDVLYIHWIDVKDDEVEKATKKIVDTFERYLEVMYG